MQGFQKATRRRAFLRMALDGPPNSGKTFTALRFAMAMGGHVGVLDSEHGRATLYVGIDMDGKPCEFDYMELQAFGPNEYVAAIQRAAQAGIDFLIVDSLSHAWAGVGGTLEQVGEAGKAFTEGWRTASPQHSRMVDAIISYPGHVIFTMRSKMAYVLEKNAAGKDVPKKIGLAPVQRPGIEYEVDWVGELDVDHVLTMTKSPLGILDGKQIHKPGAADFESIKTWLGQGVLTKVPTLGVQMASDQQVKLIMQACADLGKVQKLFRAELMRKYRVEQLHHLEHVQAESLLIGLRNELAAKASEKTAAVPADGGREVPPVSSLSPVSAPATLQQAMANDVAATPSPASPPAANGRPTDDQLRRLLELRASWGSLAGLGDQQTNKAAYAELWGKILAKRRVKSARELSGEQAQQLIDTLEAKIAEKVEERRTQTSCAEPASGPPAVSPPAGTKS